jgi:hypothetical protein
VRWSLFACILQVALLLLVVLPGHLRLVTYLSFLPFFIGSALTMTFGILFVRWLGFQAVGAARPSVWILGTAGLVAAVLFCVAGAALIAFHPIALLYLVFFVPVGLTASTAIGFALGVVIDGFLGRPRLD